MAHLGGTSPGASLDDVLAEMRTLRELVERLVGQPQERAWVTVAEAASLTFRTEAAIRKRCRTHGIGVLVNGRWQIDRSALVAPKLRDAKPQSGPASGYEEENQSHGRRAPGRAAGTGGV
jgi:hypothetical protein